MLAAVYHGPNDLRVEQVPGPGDRAGRGPAAGEERQHLRHRPAHLPRRPPQVSRRHGAHPRPRGGGDDRRVGRGRDRVTDRAARVCRARTWAAGTAASASPATTTCAPNYEAIGITLDGGFAEYMRVPAAAVLQGNVMPVGEEVDPAVAALIEPFACVLRGQNAVGIQPGRGRAGHGRRADRRHAHQAGPAARRGPGDGQRADPRSAWRRSPAWAPTGWSNPAQEDLAAVVAEETGGQGADVVIVAAPAARRAGSGPAAGRDWRADQLLWRAAQGPPDDPVRFEPGALQRAAWSPAPPPAARPTAGRRLRSSTRAGSTWATWSASASRSPKPWPRSRLPRISSR